MLTLRQKLHFRIINYGWCCAGQRRGQSVTFFLSFCLTSSNWFCHFSMSKASSGPRRQLPLATTTRCCPGHTLHWASASACMPQMCDCRQRDRPCMQRPWKHSESELFLSWVGLCGSVTADRKTGLVCRGPESIQRVSCFWVGLGCVVVQLQTERQALYAEALKTFKEWVVLRCVSVTAGRKAGVECGGPECIQWQCCFELCCVVLLCGGP